MKQISPKEVAKLLGAVVKTEIVVEEGLPDTAKRLIYFLAGLIVLLLLSITLFGWDYETEREFTADGMVTVHHFVKVLSIDLPDYKTEKFSRMDYVRAKLDRGGIQSDFEDGQVLDFRDGKVIVNRYRLDIEEKQSAQTN